MCFPREKYKYKFYLGQTVIVYKINSKKNDKLRPHDF